MSCNRNGMRCGLQINTLAVSIYYSCIDSAAKMLTRVDRCYILGKDQSILPKKPTSGQNALHCKKETVEKKVKQAFTELLPKNEINANNLISFCREY